MTLKQFASLGGKARAAKLTKQERIDIARQAGQASAKQRQLASKRETCQSAETAENK